MKLNFYIICAVLLSLLPGMTLAQQDAAMRTITVKDAAGPIVGASVLVQGTVVGTSTDINGVANLECVDSDVLSVSYLGYTSQNVAVDARTSILVVLKEDAQRLDEVVVVGYNTVRRAQTTGALAQVKGEKLEFQSSPSLENRLQGATPGLMISSGSGQPGSSNVAIRIRGTGSLNGSNTPLYIMDGVMVEPADFAALNSNDIADIQVLKDASATAIYGSRGANGVIVITTKSGQKGRTNINYRNQFGFSFLGNFYDMMDSEQNILYQWQCVQSCEGGDFPNTFPLMPYMRILENPGAYTEEQRAGALARIQKAQATNTDWVDQMTQTGFTQEHSLSVSGGNDATRFFISGSYLNQEGILKKSGLDRYSVRFNIDHKANKWLDLGLKATTGYSETTFTDPNSNDGNRTSWANPWFTTLLAYPYESPDDWFNKDNPTLITKYFDRTEHHLKTIAATYLKARITDWLSVKTNFGVDFMYTRNTETLHRDHPLGKGSNNGHYDNGTSELFRYTWTNTVNFNREFRGGHSVNAVIGMEMFQGKFNNSGFRGFDLNPDMMDSPAGIGDKNGSSKYPPQVRGGRTMSNLLSYFGQASYSYKNRYNASLSLRHDTSSKFLGDNASAMFWSLGASWLISSESWFDDAHWLNQLKLRASYGTTGNQDGVADFGSFDGFTPASYNGELGYIHGQLGNPNLCWETSEQANVGVDFSVLDSRINISMDYYHIKTKDLFMSKNISHTSGFDRLKTNAGSIVNQGLEVAVNTTPVKTQNFQWDLGFNLTYNSNKIVDLGTWATESGRYQDGDHLYEMGRPIRTWIMPEFAGINPENGEPLFVSAKGGFTENESEARLADHFGSSEIPFFGSIFTKLRYKGLQLDAQFNFAYDYTIMNANSWFINNHYFNGNKPVRMLSMWMKPGDVTDVPRFNSKNNPSPWASQFLEDASFIRLKTLRLSWMLPMKWMKKTGFIRNMSVYVQGENLFTCTGYTGGDPEVNGDVDYMSFPKPRVITFGLDINF